MSADKLLELLPEALRPSYAPLVRESDPTVHDIVKAADKLSAHIKCIEELRAGNQEFASAAEQSKAGPDGHAPAGAGLVSGALSGQLWKKSRSIGIIFTALLRLPAGNWRGAF